LEENPFETDEESDQGPKALEVVGELRERHDLKSITEEKEGEALE